MNAELRRRQSNADAAPNGASGVGSRRYTIDDLESATGISARTIRYYIAEGLLPAAKGRGKGAAYGPDHLMRLKVIAAMKETNAPLRAIRDRLDGLKDAELAAILQIESSPPTDRWRRIQLHPDLELHVRDRAGRERSLALERVVDTIVKQSEILISRDLEGEL